VTPLTRGGALQTKETLTSRPASFGSKAELSDDFIKKVFKSNITESVLSFAAFKQSKELKKNDGAKRSRLTVRPPPPPPIQKDANRTKVDPGGR
jgi:hypothetical protein